MDLLSKLHAEAATQEPVTHTDPYGNRVMALDTARAEREPFADFLGEVGEAMDAYLDDRFESEYGIEPDHPDSILVREGLI